MHKSSFLKHVSGTTFPLELVHSDVWCPTPIVSILEHRFYVIFVDAFTCFAWIFLLKQKSDVFSVFVHFKSLVENQFNTKIKTLRSNGGAEFVNHKFKAFCLDNGISHQLSCPYTLNRMGWLKESIDILLRLVKLSFIRLIFLCLIGLMLLVLMSIFLIGFHLLFLILCLLSKSFTLKSLLIML